MPPLDAALLIQTLATRTTHSNSGSNASLILAVIAAFGALTAAGIAATASIFVARRQGKYQRIQSDRDYGFRQLYELYGPIKMLRAQSEELRAKIGPSDQDLNDPQGWRLVDNIEALSKNPNSPEYKIIESILAINKRITSILYEKAGLSVEFPPPESFRLFLAHAELLEESWHARTNQQGPVRTPFPRQLDTDIDRAIVILRQRLGQQ